VGARKGKGSGNTRTCQQRHKKGKGGTTVVPGGGTISKRKRQGKRTDLSAKKERAELRWCLGGGTVSGIEMTVIINISNVDSGMCRNMCRNMITMQ
jgi:hypothetical protein